MTAITSVTPKVMSAATAFELIAAVTTRLASIPAATIPQVKSRTRAVLLDALGTLVELEPPWESLARRLGMDVEPTRAAFGEEMAFYREHAHEGRDAESLRDLRVAAAQVLSQGLGRNVTVEAMMSSIRFRAFEDAAPALVELRELGLSLVCVSNWDYALPRVLSDVGLGHLLDAVVTSAGVGVPKPGLEIFDAALRAAGCEASAALHVGDGLEEDVAGARSAGLRALLLDRTGRGDISSLAEVAGRLREGA